MKFISTLLILLTPVALSLPSSVITEGPVEAIEARQCVVTCGTICYTAAQITAARNAGYNHVKAKTKAGKSTYPHLFKNLENIKFLIPGPYQEFVLQAGSVYTGGAPGADRVVFNATGFRAGEITHTGAVKNGFVKCSGW